MNMDLFIDRLLETAQQKGIQEAEVYAQEGSSFQAKAMEGAIQDYQVSSSSGLSLRGMVEGKMGYSSTQAYDEAAIDQLIEGVRESAALIETEEQDEIFAGEKEYPELPKAESDIASVSAEEKLALCLAIEKAAMAGDHRIWKTQGNVVATATTKKYLRNTHGLNLVNEGSYCLGYSLAVAKDGESMGLGMGIGLGKKFAELNAETIGKEAAEMAVGQLYGKSVPAGEYRVIFRSDAMVDLLETFSGIFSAENTQQNLSLMGGKEGTRVASEAVTLMDDPLMPGGLATSAFDDEGSACRTKAVIDKGVLTTLLHSRKTARKQGVASTGNASRPSYTASVRVAPSNFFFKPGEKDLKQLMADMGEGLVITELGGLHAGANPTSGDFSLIAKGFLVKGGLREHAVQQITVAGNFYQMLKGIRAVGSDLHFYAGSTGSPSVDAGTLTVSGE